jgi:GGDEF domain-containing protein
MAARVGQDDFVIVLPHLSYAPDAAITVQGILDSVSQRSQVRKPEVEVDDGADLELFPVDGFESQGLLRPIAAVQEPAFTR